MGRAETHTFQWIMADSILYTPLANQQNLELLVGDWDHLSISIRRRANQLARLLITIKMGVAETRTSRAATVDSISLKNKAVV